jgi:hypothetical protein
VLLQLERLPLAPAQHLLPQSLIDPRSPLPRRQQISDETPPKISLDILRNLVRFLERKMRKLKLLPVNAGVELGAVMEGIAITFEA